ncbi:MAG TPA: SGNH/GDSL hydrolase family protein [Acidimicrobiales bacterium]
MRIRRWLVVASAGLAALGGLGLTSMDRASSTPISSSDSRTAGTVSASTVAEDTTSVVLPTPAVTIMALGDSLTDGYMVPGGYRTALAGDLAVAGAEVDFVGSLSSGPTELTETDHEGHDGWRIDQIAAIATDRLLRYQPDVVLLMIGTNDLVQDDAVATAPDRLAALIDQITTTLPGTEVLVATIPTMADPVLAARVDAYDAALPTVVARADARGEAVELVDIHDAVTVDQLADGIHPDAAGYAAMANAWFEALQLTG